MKVKKLTVKNVGIIEDLALEFNLPLILLYGSILHEPSTGVLSGSQIMQLLAGISSLYPTALNEGPHAVEPG